MPEIEEIDDEEATRLEQEQKKKKEQDEIDHAKVPQSIQWAWECHYRGMTRFDSQF